MSGTIQYYWPVHFGTYYLHRRIDALAISGCGWGGMRKPITPFRHIPILLPLNCHYPAHTHTPPSYLSLSGIYPYSPLLIVIFIQHQPILPRCFKCHPHPHLENQWCHRRPFQRSAGCQRFDSSHNVEPQTVSDCPCAEPSPVIIWISRT